MNLAEALKELEGLGTIQIAERLAKDGAKGHPTCAESCPLADWLSFNCRGRASVSQAYIYIFSWKKVDGDKYRERAVTPDNVAKFINEFDRGLFPDLIDRRW